MVNHLNKKPLTEREQEIYNLAYHRGIKKGRADERAKILKTIKDSDLRDVEKVVFKNKILKELNNAE